MHYFSNLFGKELYIFHPDFASRPSTNSMANTICCEYSTRLLMMDSKPVRNM